MMEPYIHKVHYYETDKMQITHHSNYIRFMEEARVDFLEKVGYGFDRMEADGLVSPVVGVTCDYKKTTTFAQEIAIAVSVLRCSSFKLVLGYTMTVEGKVVANGTSSHCFMDTNGKFVSLETFYPELYKTLLTYMPENK